ncbi:MAG: hypothetical protein ACYC4U_11235 [Pirellulaceae bacterium]
MMKEHPILFSGPMVRAILEGRKTMTRRVCDRVAGFGKVTEFGVSDTPGYDVRFRDRRMLWNELRREELLNLCPYGKSGDRLWVRETWGQTADANGVGLVCYLADKTAFHMLCECDGDGDPCGHGRKHYEPQVPWDQIKSRPSIHMPRWASRLTLEVTSVHAERLQDITEAAAIAEGFIKLPATGRAVLTKGAQYFGDYWSSARSGFHELWDTLNAKRGLPWESNPYVWVVAFRRLEQ